MSRLLVCWIVVFALLVPAHARAGTPYSVHWEMLQESNSCEDARLNAPGGAYFHANRMPLATFEVPGAYVSIPNGPKSNVAEAPFDSVLLRMGTNEFTFGVQNAMGNDTCVHQQNFVTLVSIPLGIQKPLFNVRRDGTAFSGSTQVGLSLSEINPPLARDVANLEVEIAAERKWLIENAAKAANLAERLDLLQQLDTELHDLVSRPLDEISEIDLDAILERYGDVVDEATRAALEQLLADLKKSVQDLKDELASLLEHFGAQADAVADLVTGEARAAGFSPDDPFEYSLTSSEVPWVEVPDVSGAAGAFEPGKDPYAGYADAVIEALSQDVQGGKVILRGDFVTNVRAWRSNTAAIEKALAARVSVSQAETSAFLQAQIRVTGFVRQYMDASDWFLDSPIPADVRAQVDGVLKNAFAEMAEQMKESLNVWEAIALGPEQGSFIETVRAFAGAMSFVGEGAAAYAEVMQTLVHASSRIAIGFVPYAGPALDLCEAVTGKLLCLPGGKDLSTEERVGSAVGFGFGQIMKAWAGIKAAGVKPGAKIVAAGVLNLGEEFTQALRASKIDVWKGLRHAVTKQPMDDFEKMAGLYLMKSEGRGMIGVGDDGVRSAIGIPKGGNGVPEGVAQAPDFLTVTKENLLVVSEAKGGGVKGHEVVSQLANAMKKLKELNLDGSVTHLELIMKKGAKMSNPNYGVVDDVLVSYLDDAAGKPKLIEGQIIRVIQL
ncbi:hypothetical protein [Polyangium jinanense]|uniref:Uncharacterized protein n=1 Tax=Polyangium jinanense TaxID=2829994 RepID=A0A9X3XAC2_9BACT|nr:hypothetical protein [Polyangium jinanense]MDC3960157.1 hypothetical protein [Polyangium jinanense]MDC3986597.1 hypothetical protein [Polyangium jinanense]